MENLTLRHRCYSFQSSGKIVYNPPRKGVEELWSAIIETDQDIVDYYRYLFLCHFKIPLLRPNWKSHISLIRGINEYTPLVQEFWKEREGEIVDFVYGQDLFWNDNFVWVNTYCPAYFQIREKMGLAHTHDLIHNWGHITIGKFMKPNQLSYFEDFSHPLPKGY